MKSAWISFWAAMGLLTGRGGRGRRSPPMGWNSWDCYGTAVTEAEVKANADYMAKKLKPHGWQYVVVDIQWSEPNAQAHGYQPDAHLAMDEYGRLIPAVNRFPSSADGKGSSRWPTTFTALGLKFGIHIMRGIPRQAVKAQPAGMGQQGAGRRHRRHVFSVPLEHRHVRHRHVAPRRPGLLRFHHHSLRRLGRGFHQGRRHRPPGRIATRSRRCTRPF